MKIEYIYPDPKEDDEVERQIRLIHQENVKGCLISSLFLLTGIFIFLLLLPFILMILGYAIAVLAVYTVYKIYFESWVLNFIQKHKRR